MESRHIAQAGIKRSLDAFADYHVAYSKYGDCQPIHQDVEERPLKRNKNLPLRSSIARISLEEMPPQKKAKRVRFSFSHSWTPTLDRDVPQPRLRPILKPASRRNTRPLRLAERAGLAEDAPPAHSSPPHASPPHAAQPAPKPVHGIDSASMKRSLDMHLLRNGLGIDAYRESVLASVYMADLERWEAAEQMRQRQAAMANARACFAEACQRTQTWRTNTQLHSADRMPPESRRLSLRPRVHLDTIAPRSPRVFSAKPKATSPVAIPNPTPRSSISDSAISHSPLPSLSPPQPHQLCQPQEFSELFPL